MELDENQKTVVALTQMSTNDLLLAGAMNDTPVKTFKQSLLELVDIPVDKEAMGELLTLPIDKLPMEKPTVGDYITGTILMKASMGDVKAFECIRDTMGQKPVETVNENRTIRVVMDDRIKEYGE